jgi:hypothetical protein
MTHPLPGYPVAGFPPRPYLRGLTLSRACLTRLRKSSTLTLVFFPLSSPWSFPDPTSLSLYPSRPYEPGDGISQADPEIRVLELEPEVLDLLVAYPVAGRYVVGRGLLENPGKLEKELIGTGIMETLVVGRHEWPGTSESREAATAKHRDKGQDRRFRRDSAESSRDRGRKTADAETGRHVFRCQKGQVEDA